MVSFEVLPAKQGAKKSQQDSSRAEGEIAFLGVKTRMGKYDYWELELGWEDMIPGSQKKGTF